MCVAESVGLRVLERLGLTVAEPYAVAVSSEFAGDLTTQYHFDDLPVIPGRHWGTGLMAEDVLEVEFGPEYLDGLEEPTELLTIFLADVVLANPDRRRRGNVLLSLRHGGKSFRIIPIDQSECFFHPSTFRDWDALWARRDDVGAQWLDGTEAAVLDAGPSWVGGEFARFTTLRDDLVSAAEEGAEEWYVRSGIDPEQIMAFLEHRIDNLPTLAQRDHWLDMAASADGGYILDV